MHTICCGIAALAVANIYYTWRSYVDALVARDRTLRDRVPFMLWTAADLAD